MSILLACATSSMESPIGALTVCLLPSGFTKVTLIVFFAAARGKEKVVWVVPVLNAAARLRGARAQKKGGRWQPHQS